MVFQQGALFEWMSVRENVSFGRRMKGHSASQYTPNVDHLLDVVGLQDFKEKATYELSGGMQQRVALARCLANDPDVILMDEPLGALDALTREKMQGLVLDLWKETGKTIILITHSVEEALLLGQRLIVMAPRPGRIHKEYRLPFAERGVGADLREVKKSVGYRETRQEILLFLAALWIMTIAARAGVSGVNITKIHAAYSLGASRRQIMRHVIVPNSLPEIFTGARVAMGVCWGTVVAAELVAAQKGAGMMIIAASKFQLTDIVIMGIILIGVVGYTIDILMRKAENWLVPWKGRS